MLTKYFSRPAVRRADCHSVFSRQNLQQALQYINTHYTENLTLQDAADFCGVSREHFSRVFKAHMGQPLYFSISSSPTSSAPRIRTASFRRNFTSL